MKKFITLLAFFATTFSLYAQVPQAVCYQAVATDTRGNELVSQAIKVRLSILKGSSAGSEEWVETHSVTTDGFGLFDLTIGLGTRTGGAQTAFSGIKWGADKYYLKVEMDITGGTNYVLMGTNQMVSVPYALYAEKAGSAGSADSAKFAIRAMYADSAGKAGRATIANFADSSRVAYNSYTSKFADSSRVAYNSYTSKFADSSRVAYNSYTSKFADSSRIAYNSYTSKFADSSRVAYNSYTSKFADSSRVAYNSYTSKFTDSSRVAYTSVFANTALTSKSSDTTKFSWLSDSTRRAAVAQTAITANYAVNAGSARRSDTATFAWLSDSTRRAGIATTAITANYAITAGTAKQADTSRFAWIADSSRRATFAWNARNSDSAKFASLADSSRRAAFAWHARNADTAKFAWLADSTRRAAFAWNARNADTAKFAWLADSTRRAASAYRAGIADSASRAAIAYNANFATLAGAANTALDDRDRDPANEIQTMSYDTSTSTLKLSKPNGQFDLVSFNSAPLRAAGASIDYPFGILGTALLIMSNYTVPAGKTLFISAVNNPIELADGKILNIEPGMPIIPSGTTISSCFCSGLLIDNQPYAEPLILDFSDPIAPATALEYTVPAGKYLIVKSGTNFSKNMSFLIDGANFDFFTGSSSSSRLVVIPEGKKIRKGLTNVGKFVVTGYLLKR
jgi:hypothetical protein